MTSAGRVTACKGDGCGRLIRWLFSEAGKRIPVDPDPHPDGNVVLVVVEGKTLARVLGGNQLPAQQDAYRPHWATCPASESFRARRSRQTARGPLCGGCGGPMPADLAELEGWDTHPCCKRPAAGPRRSA